MLENISDNSIELTPEEWEHKQKTNIKLRETETALENIDLNKTDRFELIYLQGYYLFDLIHYCNLDELQIIYATIHQRKKATDKQNDVLRLKIKHKTEEEISNNLSISRRSVRDRMELAQKKGIEAIKESKNHKNCNELRLKIINEDFRLKMFFDAIKKPPKKISDDFTPPMPPKIKD